MIQLHHIYKSFGTEDLKQDVLQDLSLEIRRGSMTAVMGPSGSGKTTLLNIIGLLDREYSGEYLLDSTDMTSLDELEAGKIRNLKIGFVFQSFHLMKDLTVLENVRMASVIKNSLNPRRERVSSKQLTEKACDMLERFGLKDHIYHKTWQLSGGQMQRAAMARALMNDPELILADEPTGALDLKNSLEIMEIFEELHKDGKTLIIVTHNDKVAAYCEEIIEFTGGHIL